MGNSVLLNDGSASSIHFAMRTCQKAKTIIRSNPHASECISDRGIIDVTTNADQRQANSAIVSTI